MISGYYWIDPNLGSPSDAVQLYCMKPGCSCLDCKSTSQQSGNKGQMFSEQGEQVGMATLDSVHYPPFRL